ncbi:hypothetical protein Bbelb_320330 [Branchiostoma belcheri]|nr:hypothetical protein Bbelb_320330 [Branchiostoma belcheri]
MSVAMPEAGTVRKTVSHDGAEGPPSGLQQHNRQAGRSRSPDPQSKGMCGIPEWESLTVTGESRKKVPFHSIAEHRDGAHIHFCSPWATHSCAGNYSRGLVRW